MSSKKCPVCSKSCYPLEGIAHNDVLYHKLCFKCEECKQKLTLQTFQPHIASGKIYCKSHYPSPKSTAVTDSVAMRNARDAPTLDTVNQQVRGEEDTHSPAAVLDIKAQNALRAPKVATVNENIRVDSDMQKPAAVLDIKAQNALKAPKVGTVNEQIRVDESLQKPAAVLDMKAQNAVNAPKVDLAPGVQRGTGEKPEFNIVL
eukprot:m51a1_g9278 hypothetical protein (203) ;mRNA; r:114637-115486